MTGIVSDVSGPKCKENISVDHFTACPRSFGLCEQDGAYSLIEAWRWTFTSASLKIPFQARDIPEIIPHEG